MILAKQEDGTQLTFPNKQMFEEAKTYKKLTLIQADMKDVKSFKEIEVEEIIPTGNSEDQVVIHRNELTEYTVPKFRDNLKNFSNDDLEMFIKFDERKTIINESKKELKRRS